MRGATEEEESGLEEPPVSWASQGPPLNVERFAKKEALPPPPPAPSLCHVPRAAKAVKREDNINERRRSAAPRPPPGRRSPSLPRLAGPVVGRNEVTRSVRLPRWILG